MIEKLTEKDKKLMFDYINTFGPIRDEEPNGNFSGFDIILNEWDCAKSNLYKLLGNNFIITKPYTFTYNTEAIVKKMTTDKSASAYKDFYRWLSREVLAPMSNQDYGVYQMILETINTFVLAENKYPHTTMTYYLPPDNEKFKVSKGMRPMRILSKIAQKYNCDKAIFERFRIWHSQMLNKQTIEGELCLSIHPLDFMTMSDNDNHWSSCMSWIDNGDYRCGTVECMNSPYILVAYLHNPEHPMTLFDESWVWNNKHWRELFIVQPEILAEIKGYCFQDEPLTDTVLSWIKELAATNLGWTYDNQEINLADECIPWNEHDDLMINISPENYMYNDYGSLDKHKALINREKIGKYPLTEWQDKGAKNWHYMAEFTYGGVATCMWCGQPIEEKDRDNAVMCLECDNGTYCACCGEYIPKNYFYYIEDLEGPICEECYETECFCDSITGDTHLDSNCTHIYWLIDTKENGQPIFYNFPLYIYNLEENEEYQNIFRNKPYIYQENNGDIKYYITLDDAIDKAVFSSIFDLEDSIENIIQEYTAN